MKESTFQRKAIEQLRARGCYVFKPVGSLAQQRGTPDLLICYQGLFVGAELKVEGRKPSKLQELELSKIRNAGGIADAVWSIEELEQLLAQAERNRGGSHHV